MRMALLVLYVAGALFLSATFAGMIRARVRKGWLEGRARARAIVLDVVLAPLLWPGLLAFFVGRGLWRSLPWGGHFVKCSRCRARTKRHRVTGWTAMINTEPLVFLCPMHGPEADDVRQRPGMFIFGGQRARRRALGL